MGKLKYSMPSIWEYLPVYKYLLDEKPHYIKDDITIDSVFGVFLGASRLAGGRFIAYNPDNAPSKQEMTDTVKFYNDRNISVRYTYSNLVATHKHLDDELFNWTLDMAHNSLNGVIVGNRVVEDYIRSTYPKLKIISSVTNWNTSIDHARRELDRGVDMLVLNSALVRQYDLIKDLDLSRVEVMLNDGCLRRCAVRFEHYSMESHMNLCYDPYTMFHDNADMFVAYHEWSSSFCCYREETLPPPPPPPDLPNRVPYDFKIPERLMDSMPAELHNRLITQVWDIQDDEYLKLLDIGVVNFKLAGRELEIPPGATFYTLKTFQQMDEIDDLYREVIDTFEQMPMPIPDGMTPIPAVLDIPE